MSADVVISGISRERRGRRMCRRKPESRRCRTGMGGEETVGACDEEAFVDGRSRTCVNGRNTPSRYCSSQLIYRHDF